MPVRRSLPTWRARSTQRGRLPLFVLRPAQIVTFRQQRQEAPVDGSVHERQLICLITRSHRRGIEVTAPEETMAKVMRWSGSQRRARRRRMFGDGEDARAGVRRVRHVWRGITSFDRWSPIQRTVLSPACAIFRLRRRRNAAAAMSTLASSASPAVKICSSETGRLGGGGQSVIPASTAGIGDETAVARH